MMKNKLYYWYQIHRYKGTSLNHLFL